MNIHFLMMCVGVLAVFFLIRKTTGYAFSLVVAAGLPGNIANGKYNNIFNFLTFLLAAISTYSQVKPIIETTQMIYTSVGGNLALVMSLFMPPSTNEESSVKIQITEDDVKIIYLVNEGGNVKYFTFSKYPLGKYQLQNVDDADSTLSGILQCLNALVVDHEYSPEKIAILIVGQSDGKKSSHPLYSGRLGTIKNFPYFDQSNELKYANFIPRRTKVSNEGFAFMRAYDVYLNISGTSSNHEEFKYVLQTKVVPDIGKIHRKTTVHIVLKDAIKQKRAELNWLQRVLFDYAFSLQ